ncbi:hypothetical protein OH77DRAFT_1525578 [Trametes cingulata]|nr:hypothetical protein OH77DRAFT_1525578 [Trametes cingulata]
MTAVQNALMNEDILVEVFSQLSIFPKTFSLDRYLTTAPHQDTDSEASSTIACRRKTLANAALTCRAFAGPASDELWASPPKGIYALLNLFQWSIVQMKQPRGHSHHGGDSVTTYCLGGALDASEWASFARCAARVRELWCNTVANSVRLPFIVEPAVFVELYSRSEGQNLFPRLVSVLWGGSRDIPGNIQLLRMLAQPSVTCLVQGLFPALGKKAYRALGSRNPHHDINLVVESCPRLQHVLVETPLTLEQTLPFARCSMLQRIHLKSSTVHPILLHRLAHLPRLEELRVHSVSLGPPESLGERAGSRVKPRRPTKFSALRRFIIGSISYDPRSQDISDFCSDILSEGLSSSDIDEVQLGSHEDIVRFVDVVYSTPFASSLRRLSLHLRCSAWENGRPDVAFSVMAAPLLNLSGLEEVSIFVHNAYLGIADDDLTCITCAWPRITSLHLDSSLLYNYEGYALPHPPRGVPHPVRPSLHAIICMALWCRQLGALGICAGDVSDADVLAAEELAVGNTAPQTQLTQLVLMGRDGMRQPGMFDIEPMRSSWSVSDIDRLANALLRVFPNLEGDGVLKPGERYGAYRPRWWNYLWKGSQAYQLGLRLDSIQAESRPERTPWQSSEALMAYIPPNLRYSHPFDRRHVVHLTPSSFSRFLKQ